MSGNHTSHVLHVATELCKALNEKVDEHLPEKLAGIVKTHSLLAVGSAAIPVPGVDAVAAATNIWTMYVRINKELNLPFAQNALRSIATGIATNLAAFAAGTWIAGTVLKTIPGLGSVGGAVVMAATVYAVTLVSALVYMSALTKLLKSKCTVGLSDDELKAATDELLKDKASLKAALKEAKAAYRAEKRGKEEVAL